MIEEKKALVEGLAEIELSLSELQIDQLMAYLALLIKWNKAYNLSAIRDPLAMVHLHLLDSLVISQHLSGTHFADIGTGAGLPGIPLAIIKPECNFTLVDSAGKKTRFLVQVAQSLELKNVTVHHGRVEQLNAQLQFDGILSRAFTSLQDMTQKCKHLLSSSGKFYAMKGQLPRDELSQVEKHYIVHDCHTLQVPGVDAQRCLVVIEPVSNNTAQAM